MEMVKAEEEMQERFFSKQGYDNSSAVVCSDDDGGDVDDCDIKARGF